MDSNSKISYQNKLYPGDNVNVPSGTASNNAVNNGGAAGAMNNASGGATGATNNSNGSATGSGSATAIPSGGSQPYAQDYGQNHPKQDTKPTTKMTNEQINDGIIRQAKNSFPKPKRTYKIIISI